MMCVDGTGLAKDYRLFGMCCMLETESTMKLKLLNIINNANTILTLNL